MKYLLLPAFLLLSLFSFSQITPFKTLLDSGKKEYQYQFSQNESNYNKALDLFQKAVQLEPNNTEARYFYGYAIDKVNSQGALDMNQSKVNMVLKASEQFEFVLKQEPLYQGEILILDPYAKITAIWGSLALSYLNAGKEDSARWAMKEGRNRGGFTQPLLEFSRQMLNSCEQNAILLTYGDNMTFPSLYLQLIDNYRADTWVVDLNLIHSSWYPKYLKRIGVDFSYSDVEIDSLSYRQWTPTTISITNKQKPEQTFSWKLKPTYQQDYILKGDLILLDLFTNYVFKRDFYFSTHLTDTTINLFLDDFIVNDGIVCRVHLEQKNDQSFSPSPNLQKYNLATIKEQDIKISQDAIFLLNNFRIAYIFNIYNLAAWGQHKKAAALYNEMMAKFPVEKLPFGYDAIQRMHENITEYIKNQ